MRTEAQRGQEACLRSNSYDIREPGFAPRLRTQAHALCTTLFSSTASFDLHTREVGRTGSLAEQKTTLRHRKAKDPAAEQQLSWKPASVVGMRPCSLSLCRQLAQGGLPPARPPHPAQRFPSTAALGLLHRILTAGSIPRFRFNSLSPGSSWRRGINSHWAQ